MKLISLTGAIAGSLLALAACGGSSSSTSSALPSEGASVRVRFVEGAPFLETPINGVPTDIGQAYLQVDGATVASTFTYGTVTQFSATSAGTHSLRALDELGYAVGPLKTPALSAGGRYTLALVGAYPTYRVIAFAEPASGGEAQLSLYEASPTVAQADFGGFRASSHSNFKRLGSATFGNVATVALGKSVSNFGGYAGPPSKPLGAFALAQIDAFDSHNALPFHAASRLSLFLFDAKSGSANGPVFGSLDR
jgi:hypothetical protein